MRQFHVNIPTSPATNLRILTEPRHHRSIKVFRPPSRRSPSAVIIAPVEHIVGGCNFRHPRMAGHNIIGVRGLVSVLLVLIRPLLLSKPHLSICFMEKVNLSRPSRKGLRLAHPPGKEPQRRDLRLRIFDYPSVRAELLYPKPYRSRTCFPRADGDVSAKFGSVGQTEDQQSRPHFPSTSSDCAKSTKRLRKN